MSAEQPTGASPAPSAPAAPSVGEVFEIHRRTSLYVLLLLATLGLAAGFAWLAWDRQDHLLWAPAGLLLLLGLLIAPGVRDSRTPLFVADDHGVRLRDSGHWVGLLWSEMGEIRVERREGRHDPRVKVITPDGRRVYSAPVGPATTVSAGEAEIQLARRRGPAAY